MAIKVVIHIMGEDPVMGEMEKEPLPTDNFIHVTNLTRVDGKDVAYLSEGVVSIMFPWHRITFLEIMGGESAGGKVVGFFR